MRTIDQVIEAAANLRKSGVSWANITKEMNSQGFTTINGGTWHMANLAAFVLKKYPTLREHKRRTKAERVEARRAEKRARREARKMLAGRTESFEPPFTTEAEEVLKLARSVWASKVSNKSEMLALLLK